MPLRNERKTDRRIIAAVSIAWALFQLALPRLIILDSTTVRAAHLAFAITLVFLTYRGRAKRKWKTDFSDATSHIPIIDYVLASLACLSVLYFVFDWTGITMRAGLPIRRDVVISVILIVLLLEATRRAIGPALAIIAILFTLYAFLGPYMPSIFAFRGVSLRRYLSQIALSTEGIYGIPLHVSANTVFLFVLFGSMLDKIGAGHFFNDLALSLLGRF
ncbi:MAG: TRAP transporter large permease subunit, partial [Planctomycetota bacterium]